MGVPFLEFTVPKFSLPVFPSVEEPQPDEPTERSGAPDRPPAADPAHPPSAAAEVTMPRRTRKKAFVMVSRLLASFARSEAIHQARLDECWRGPNWHLMAHTTWSAK